jgi:RNA polymerase sigma factor (sigma-70 family)
MQDATQHLGLVGYTIKPYVGLMEYDDLFQTGCLGLLDACKRYQPTGGTFSTYAVRRIKGAVLDELRRINGGRRAVKPVFEPLTDYESTGDNFEDAACERAWVVDTLTRALTACMPKQRALLYELYVLERPAVEIARREGVGGEAMYQRKLKAINRARRAVT